MGYSGGIDRRNSLTNLTIAPTRYAHRGPHCHNPIEIIAESEIHESECPRFGSHLNLATEGLTTERQEVRKVARPEHVRILQFSLQTLLQERMIHRGKELRISAFKTNGYCLAYRSSLSTSSCTTPLAGRS